MAYSDPTAKRRYDQQRYAENRDKLLAQAKARYETNREARLVYMRSYTKRRLERYREIVMEAKAQACMDCNGRFHFAAMDFDHRPDEVKTANITDLMRNMRVSEKTLRAEMAKCDVVCSNCHRVRTYERNQHDSLEATG